jgi:hypothetical protein
MVSVISEPERWTHKRLENCFHSYNKIFVVTASSRGDVESWAEKFSTTDAVRSRGNCGETKWNVQPIGATFAVHFVYEVDSGD